MTRTLSAPGISTATVAEVRDRFPTDPAAQRAIDRKFTRRQGPGWSPIGLDELTEALRG